MTVDIQIRALLDMVNAHGAPDFGRVTPAEGRAGIQAMIDMINRDRPPIEGVTAQDIGVDRDTGLCGRLYRPDGDGGLLPGLVFFHGGGWVAGDLETHDIFCRQFARLAGCILIAVDYRLAPEHVFPAAIDDAVAAVAAVCRDCGAYGIDPRRLLVGGDSAGGSLAAIVAQRAGVAGHKLAGQLLICPSTDLTGPSRPDGSHVRFASGYLLSAAEIAWCTRHYLPEGTDRRDPRVSPLHGAGLADLPPAIIATAGYDPIRDEGVAYASALAMAGTGVIYHHFPSLIHGFNLFDAVSDEADRAVRTIAAAVRSLFASAE